MFAEQTPNNVSILWDFNEFFLWPSSQRVNKNQQSGRELIMQNGFWQWKVKSIFGKAYFVCSSTYWGDVLQMRYAVLAMRMYIVDCKFYAINIPSLLRADKLGAFYLKNEEWCTKTESTTPHNDQKDNISYADLHWMTHYESSWLFLQNWESTKLL